MKVLATEMEYLHFQSLKGSSRLTNLLGVISDTAIFSLLAVVKRFSLPSSR